MTEKQKNDNDNDVYLRDVFVIQCFMIDMIALLQHNITCNAKIN